MFGSRSARDNLVSMLKVGVIGFGGGSALIPLMDDELVARRRSMDDATFTRQTVVASITPGALPVKLAGLAGLQISGARLALAMAVTVALPGTVMTIAALAAVSAGGEAAMSYIAYASVGITAFIIALLAHYIGKVMASETRRRDRAVAALIAVSAFLVTGATETVTTSGHLIGRRWEISLPHLNAVQVVVGALVLISVWALLKGRKSVHLPRPSSVRRRDPRFARSAALFFAAAVVAVIAAIVAAGPEVLTLLGLVGGSTLTSFGGGEAYVGVADGFFVSNGYVDSTVFYSQLVPIANALPGPILVKLASGIGYAAVSPTHGELAGWVVAGAAGLLAVAACTGVAVLAMGAYERASDSPVIRAIGRYVLPVICGLLATTSAAMLNASATVASTAGVSPAPVLWLSIVGVGAVAWLRRRGTVHDVVLLGACGLASLAGLLAT